MDWQQVWEQFRDFITRPKALILLGILVGGWLVAVVLSVVVRGLLRKTSLDDRVARWVLGEEKARTIDVEKGAAKLVYYLVLLFVLVAFLHQIGLEGVSEPINAFLLQVAIFAPRLIAAVVLAMIAWLVARAIRAVVVRVLSATKLDDRFRETGLQRTEAEEEEGEEDDGRAPVPISRTIGETAYWVVFLLFVPIILDPLQLQGLLAPVQSMLDEVLATLPNIASAVLILVVGWMVARILQRVIRNVLAAAGLDRLATRVGIARALGKRTLSELVGVIVYALVLLPVVIGALNALQLEAISAPASNMLDLILASIPHLVGAALLLGIAFVVARLVAGLVTNVLAGVGFDRIFVTLGIAKEPGEGKWAPSAVAGTLVIVAILLFASMEAARLLGFEVLAVMIAEFTAFGGQVLVGLVVFGIGMLLSNLVANAIEGSQAAQSHILALAARVAILVLAGAMALRQMGLANEIIQLAFGLTLGAAAVAVALAFGLGSREIAGREVQSWVSKLKSKRPPEGGGVPPRT